MDNSEVPLKERSQYSTLNAYSSEDNSCEMWSWQSREKHSINYSKYGPRIRLISVLTSAKLNIDEPFEDDLCGNCEKCIKACPTKALEPCRIKINRCLVYAAEEPDSKNVSKDVREIEKRLTKRPTSNSYVECTICINACPYGRTIKNIRE